jgi:transcriptional regulator with XRE-family HTH domain
MDTNKIGQYIRSRRKAENLTQQQLAQKLNVSFQAVSKWENGDALPDVGLLLELADILNTTTDKLLSGGTIFAGERRRMRVADVIEGFTHIEAIGRCFGEESTFYTGMIEGINQKMNIDLIEYLGSPQTRSIMIMEVLIQGIMNGYAVDMDEVRSYITNPNMLSVIEGYMNTASGNRLLQAAEGYIKARRIAEGQLIVVTTGNGSIRMFESDLSEGAEQAVLDELKTPVGELLCCGHDCKAAAPSEFIRAGLLAAFPENAEATVYLPAEEGLCAKKLSELE